MQGLYSKQEVERITQAIEEMKKAAGGRFDLAKINLAELERRSGVSRQRLRRLQANSFEFRPHGNAGKISPRRVLNGFTGILDSLLMSGITNSTVCMERLQAAGFAGGISAVKDYIAAHKDLVQAKRHLVEPQGSRGQRYETKPGEAYQMDWGFVSVLDAGGNEYRVACFALCCHHCGSMFIEFFPNAKQESLFIGMISAFQYMGIPEYVLTDNMKSIVDHRDMSGKPVWNREYEAFMNTVGFKTKLCKPRHPYTKGKVERLVRFVKGNFLSGRTFWNVTDLNAQALEWCDRQNNSFHKGLYGLPWETNLHACAEHLLKMQDTPEVRRYLCPVRKISFDGFVNYEGRRFGVPYQYVGKYARISRQGENLYIYSADMLSRELVKETLNQHTNQYKKLANIYFDRADLSFGYGGIETDEDVDAFGICRRAENLFELYQKCATRRQIETICVNYLRSLEATKVTGNGHNYFVPNHSMAKVDAFECFIDELNAINKNSDTLLTANSFYIIDDAKQRDKMTEEFYSAVKKEIAEHQDRADYLIKSGCSSAAILERWVIKIATLEEKKRHYEDVLRRELDGLDDEFDTLKLLSQELSVRARGLRAKAA